MFCYLWTLKNTGTPYLGIVEGSWVHHPQLQSEKRSRMKVMYFDPEKDLPIKDLHNILDTLITKFNNHV